MKVWLVILFVCLLFCGPVSAASAGFLITEFCPDGYAKGDGDEYFVLSGTGPLDGWAVSDGEGSISFPTGASAREQVIVAREGQAYHDIHATYPDYEIIGTVPSVPDAVRTGRFQMANTKDDLSLLRNGRIVQTVSWPDVISSRNGQVHIFHDGVWDARVLKIGQSRFVPETFSADGATFFTSPDCSYEPVLSAVRSADTTLLISMYEFTHPDIAAAVADASRRGTAVTLLMEGGPVGGIADEEKAILDYLADAGVAVYTIESTDSLPARYRYVHTKYFVADGDTTVILSENFKPSGIPLPGTRGNRGWGAVLYSSEIAEYFTRVFTADIGGYDIYPYVSSGRNLPESWSDTGITVHLSPLYLEFVRIEPVFSPDTSNLIPELLQSASATIDIQQAYITNYPGTAHNLWLESALSAAGRGITVRILLDAMYYNTDGENDNDEIVAQINRIAKERNLPVEARLMHPNEEITKLHNKGVIIDGDTVLISSINWNYNSPNFNRESGIIVKNADAAAYFTKVFEYDWDGGFEKHPLGPGTGLDLRLIAVVGICAVLTVIWLLRRRK